MAQVLTESRRSSSISTSKIMNVVLWVLQITAAGIFLMVGFLKLSGNAQMPGLFEAIGLGSDSCDRIALANRIAGRQQTKFSAGLD